MSVCAQTYVVHNLEVSEYQYKKFGNNLRRSLGEGILGLHAYAYVRSSYDMQSVP